MSPLELEQRLAEMRQHIKDEKRRWPLYVAILAVSALNLAIQLYLLARL